MSTLGSIYAAIVQEVGVILVKRQKRTKTLKMAPTQAPNDQVTT